MSAAGQAGVSDIVDVDVSACDDRVGSVKFRVDAGSQIDAKAEATTMEIGAEPSMPLGKAVKLGLGTP